MPQLRVHNITVSVDGYAAGPRQRLEHPLGEGFEGMHEWMFAAMRDLADGKEGIDVEYVGRGEENIGATIMGRNMFGPQRGPWEDESWTGWWGPNPPYHNDVFVHTHHLRPSVAMEGGTTFHFTDEPPRRSSPGPSRRRRARTSGSAADRPPSSSICAPG